MLNDKEVLIINNFLTKDECNLLLSEISSSANDLWEIREDGKDRANLKLNNHKLLIKIHNRLSSYFDSSFKLQLIRFAHRTTKNTIWDLHSDDEGGSEIKYGIIIYLNDNFIGGELNYVSLNFKYQPKAGDLVIHPADKEYLHFVEKVKDGDRYTLTSFARDFSNMVQ